MIDKIYTSIKNGNPEIDLFPKTFNTIQYLVGVTIFNLNTEYKIQLRTQQFKKLIIRNTLDQLYPVMQFSFIDFQGVYTNVMSNFGQYIRIVIEPPDSTETEGEQNKMIDLIFSIENHIIQRQDSKEVHYKLQGKLWTARNYGMHINYSTFINSAESNRLSPYQIIQNVLKKINYPVEKIPKTTSKIYYITDQDETVKDVVTYCLEHACNKDNYPSYLCHNILTNKPMFLNRIMPEKETEYEVNTHLQMFTPAGLETLEKTLTITNAKIFSSNRSNAHYQQKALDIAWHYDTLKRKWTQEVLMPDKIDEILTTTTKQEKGIKTSFVPETYQESNIRHYRHNQEHNLYNKLKDLELGTNNIQFLVIGNILREVGQTVTINCREQNYLNMYGGAWRIYSIMHIFEHEHYVNDIVGYRTFNYNHKEDEEKKNE